MRKRTHLIKVYLNDEEAKEFEEWVAATNLSKSAYLRKLILRFRPIAAPPIEYALPVSGGTKLAKAVQYCLNEKPYLYRCLENGNIPVDNNRAENAIRPFVIGRKNWLFANSVKGAEASALIYSLAATATANGLNVEEYFTRLCRSEPSLPWE